MFQRVSAAFEQHTKQWPIGAIVILHFFKNDIELSNVHIFHHLLELQSLRVTKFQPNNNAVQYSFLTSSNIFKEAPRGAIHVHQNMEKDKYSGFERISRKGIMNPLLIVLWYKCVDYILTNVVVFFSFPFSEKRRASK